MRLTIFSAANERGGQRAGALGVFVDVLSVTGLSNGRGHLGNCSVCYTACYISAGGPGEQHEARKMGWKQAW